MTEAPQIYRHTKTGRMYLYLGAAMDTATAKPVVVYQALYDRGQLFTRPWDEFFGTIEGGALRFDPDWRTAK